MGRGRDLTPAERSEIIGARKCGVPLKIISEKLNVSSSTVEYTVRRWQKRQESTTVPRLGRPSKLSETEGETLIQRAREDPFVSLEEMRQGVPHVDRVTILRFMNKSGFEKRPADHALKGPRPRQAMAWIEARKIDVEVTGDKINPKPRSTRKANRQPVHTPVSNADSHTSLYAHRDDAVGALNDSLPAAMFVPT